MSEVDYVATPYGKVPFFNPQPEHFDPWQTGKALSYINRFAGNWGPYSVAQHSVMVCGVVRYLEGSTKQQLAALHHDDSEMVIGDIPNPIKTVLPELEAIENRIQNAINMRYNCYIQDSLVRKADYIVFQNEVRCLVPPDKQHLFTRYNVDDCEVLLTRKSMLPQSPEEAFADYYSSHEILEDKMYTEMITVGEA